MGADRLLSLHDGDALNGLAWVVDAVHDDLTQIATFDVGEESSEQAAAGLAALFAMDTDATLDELPAGPGWLRPAVLKHHVGIVAILPSAQPLVQRIRFKQPAGYEQVQAVKWTDAAKTRAGAAYFRELVQETWNDLQRELELSQAGGQLYALDRLRPFHAVSTEERKRLESRLGALDPESRNAFKATLRRWM